MIKTLFVAAWACLITLAASYGIHAFMQTRADAPPPAEASASEARKTKEINIPIIRDGAVRGYVVLQLSYVVDLAIAKKLPVEPDAFVIDEAFRYVFDDDKIDFAHLDKIELDQMTRLVISRVNARMKSEVITDMGVLACNFLLNAEAKTNGEGKGGADSKAPAAK